MRVKGIAKTKTVYQMEATECGAASLCMIMKYWGHCVPLEQMRIETGVSRDGCAAGNIMRAAMKFGLETHGYKKDVKGLTGLLMPCIIFWKSNHFVVLEGFKGKYAFIDDPAAGRYRVKINEFGECFSGIAITFKPTDSFKKEDSAVSSAGFIRERLADNKKTILKMVFTGMIVSIPGFLMPYFSQIFTDKILGNKGFSVPGLFLAAVAFTVISQAFFDLYRNNYLLEAQSRRTFTSSRSFLGHLFRLPISFFEQRYTGDLVTRVSDNDSINLFISGTLAGIILDCITAVVFGIILFIYSVPLTLIALAGLVLNLLFVNIMGGLMSDATVRLKQDSGELTGITAAGIGISAELKACGAQLNYAGRMTDKYKKVLANETRTEFLKAMCGMVTEILDDIVLVLIITFGSVSMIKQEMTPGMILAFIALYKFFSAPVRSLADSAKGLQELKVDIERVNDIMRHPESETYEIDGAMNSIHEKLSGNISCRDISFSYGPLSKNVIEDINFEIGCGSMAAIVGASGSGKSTVSKLISGLYRPNSGSIYIDGKDVNGIDLDVFHASISTVSQNITLFAGTVRDNITMWNPAISEQDMINAAKDACIHDDIIKKKDAYDHVLSENASNMSGGQRQRLEIARALVTNPSILIMDEATSALDPLVEKQIIENIRRRGCTCIMTAHRLSAVRDCDFIAVMDKGRIVQMGSHDELSAEEGLYRELMSCE